MGVLFVVATPIGNLEDITLRAIRVLRDASLIAAEDTRKTGKLLAFHSIETPLISCFEHNESARIAQLLSRLARQDVALVSDAGTPGISDPGYRLITAAIDAGIEVVPVPGPSAVTTALAISGLPTDGALYLGFLPRKPVARRQALSAVAGQPYTLIAFEAPHRLLRSLADIQETMGDRRLVVARELTKLHEETLRGTVSELIAHFTEDAPRGEMTLVIEGAQQEGRRWPASRVLEALSERLEKGLRRKDAARQLASESGWSTRDIYELREESENARVVSGPTSVAGKETQLMHDTEVGKASLDDPGSYDAVDPDDMLGRVRELPEQCENAWAAIASTDLRLSGREYRNLIVLGMGGSAIGADLNRTLVAQECTIPMIVNRDYDVPAFVDEHTLAVASSYSGDTEETLAALERARAQGATIAALAVGGELARRAKELGIPWVPIKYRSQPRAALGHSLILLLGVMHKAGLVSDKSREVAEAVRVMRDLQAEIGPEIPTATNAAKQLARALHGRLPVVYGSGYLSEVARRVKGQFNENSKNWSFYEILPELDHNAVLGYQFPGEMAQHVVVILLRSRLDHPQTAKRFDVTREVLQRRGVSCQTVESRGKSPLAAMLSVIHFCDHVSYYLALLNGVDPSTVNEISYLKRRLAEAE